MRRRGKSDTVTGQREEQMKWKWEKRIMMVFALEIWDWNTERKEEEKKIDT